MQEVRTGDREQFPRYGARARLWGRFERDLREWLETPEGRFAAWRARAGASEAPARERDDRTR
ncbi:MAG TPA: hypothetical protein VK904_09625 [Miltoncostaeaceae bacterium]|nr:hypothetical protein [Miltoncostaeaceae bacterium]